MLNIGRQKGGQGKYDLGNKIEFEGWKSEENICLGTMVLYVLWTISFT